MPCGGAIDGTIDRNNAAKRREAIGIECSLNRIGAACPGGHAAGIGVLDHDRRRLEGVAPRRLSAVAELTHRGEGSLEIKDVVVAELLALELLARTQACPRLGVPGGALVGIFAVAQALARGQLQAERAGALRCQLRTQPLADGGVVLSGVAEGFQGQLTPQLRANRSSGQGLQKRGILRGTGQDRHVRMVLGGCAHHRWPADVDVLNRRVPADIGPSNRLAEGIEIDHDHIDRGNALVDQITLVGGLRALCQDSAVNPGVQCFHASPKDLGGTGVLSDLGHRNPSGRQRRGRTAA